MYINQDEQQNKYNPKLDIPEFEGKINVDEFIDWLNMVEKMFEFHEPPEQKKVKLVTLKLRWNAVRIKSALRGRRGWR